MHSGPGPAGSRGASLVWALSGTHLVVTGFDKVSERQILLYKATDLSSPVCTVGLDVSPAILLTHIDHDSGTLFLTGRGDSTIYCYEVSSEVPHLCALSHHRAASLHQSIAYLHKNLVAVDKSELFQDDLFPATLVTWQPWQRGRDWLDGHTAPPKTQSLQPPGMEPLSAHTGASPVSRDKPQPQSQPQQPQPQKPKPDLIKSHLPADTKDKQDSIMKSMSAKVQITDELEMNLKLEQDNMEGVDETEWEQ